jgi:hypothetical protein
MTEYMINNKTECGEINDYFYLNVFPYRNIHYMSFIVVYEMDESKNKKTNKVNQITIKYHKELFLPHIKSISKIEKGLIDDYTVEGFSFYKECYNNTLRASNVFINFRDYKKPEIKISRLQDIARKIVMFPPNINTQKGLKIYRNINNSEIKFSLFYPSSKTKYTVKKRTTHSNSPNFDKKSIKDRNLSKKRKM